MILNDGNKLLISYLEMLPIKESVQVNNLVELETTMNRLMSIIRRRRANKKNN